MLSCKATSLPSKAINICWIWIGSLPLSLTLRFGLRSPAKIRDYIDLGGPRGGFRPASQSPPHRNWRFRHPHLCGGRHYAGLMLGSAHEEAIQNVAERCD